jgi:hypothetical protein
MLRKYVTLELYMNRQSLEILFDHMNKPANSVAEMQLVCDQRQYIRNEFDHIRTLVELQDKRDYIEYEFTMLRSEIDAKCPYFFDESIVL